MNRSSLALAAILAVAAFGANAESPDPSGQFAIGSHGQQTRAAVQAQQVQARQAGENPWATSYNPLKSFRSERTRAEVQADFVANRDRVAAFTREDSGSAYLAHNRGTVAAPVFAGTPVNAQ